MMQGGAILVAGILVIYLLLWWQMREMREDIVQADKALALGEKRLVEVTQKLSPGAKPGATFEEQVAQLEKQIAARQRVRDVMDRGLFSNTTGYSNFFIAFARQHVPGMWLTGFDITGAGENMRLEGRTTDPAQVARYVQKLSAEQVMVGKEFQVFVMSRPEKKEGQAAESAYVNFMFRTSTSKDPKKS
jgi:Tfp pilus assembly protein PilN